MALSWTTAIALLVTALTLAPHPTPAAFRPPPAARSAASPAARVGTPPASRRVLLARRAPIVLPPAPLVLAFARLIYRPGSRGDRQAVPGPLLLVVDSGALAADLAAPGRLQRATAADGAADDACRGGCRLAVGDRLLLPAASPAFAGSPGAQAVAGAFNRADPPRWNATWSPGAAVMPLVSGWAVDLDAPTATLALARLSLEPGAQGTVPASGIEAVVVETGAATLTTADGLVWLQRPAAGNDWLASGTPATLLGGEGALLQAGASAQLRNDGGGPLELLVLTVAAA
jgi:hypothetical protein